VSTFIIIEKKKKKKTRPCDEKRKLRQVHLAEKYA